MNKLVIKVIKKNNKCRDIQGGQFKIIKLRLKIKKYFKSNKFDQESTACNFLESYAYRFLIFF